MEYPYYEDDSDMPEADQEEADDWCPGGFLSQWPHRPEGMESPVSTDTKAAQTLSGLTITVSQYVQPKTKSS